MKISDEEFEKVRIIYDADLPEWNYVIYPNSVEMPSVEDEIRKIHPCYRKKWLKQKDREKKGNKSREGNL